MMFKQKILIINYRLYANFLTKIKCNYCSGAIVSENGPILQQANYPSEGHEEEDLKIEGFDEYLCNLEDLESETSNPKKEEHNMRPDRTLAIKNFERSLKPYLNVCIYSDLTDRAYNTFVWYRYKFLKEKNLEPIIGISYYNILLRGLARKGDLKKFKIIFKLINSGELEPNLHSYASKLLCLTKKKSYQREEVKNIINEMQRKKLNINNLLNKALLTPQERRVVVQLVHEILPSLKFNPPFFHQNYDLKILEDFEKIPQEHQIQTTGINFNKKLLLKAVKKQFDIETKGHLKIDNTYYDKKECQKYNFYQVQYNKLMKEWKQTLETEFKKELDIMKKKTAFHNGINLYPYLTSLDTNRVIEIILDELGNIASYGEESAPPLSYIYTSLGSKVMKSYIESLKVKLNIVDETKNMYLKYLTYFTNGENLKRIYNNRTYWKQLAVENGFYKIHNFNELIWPSEVRLAIGKLIYGLIFQNLKIDQNILATKTSQTKLLPAFFSVYKSYSVFTREELKINKTFSKLIKGSNFREIRFSANMLPMLCPPVPWTSPSMGGFLTTKSILIRDNFYGEDFLFDYGIKSNKNLNGVYDSLNAVSNCPWKINKKILEIALKVFRNNGDESVSIPLHDSVFADKVKTLENSSKDKLNLAIQRFKLRRDQANMYSSWCDCLYKLSIADHYKDSLFWLPNNCDFRGRVYPCPPYLHHLGNDLSRGLLLFGVGKPLGPKGLDWLKIHLVNLTSLKKNSSILERLEYADTILPKIFDSADNPLDGKMWWKSQEDPWQILACCMEIANAIRHSDPSQYICHFPVHQDGSCNGLQHYAALGRDQFGAESVNLQPHDKPQDVYSVVASLVEHDRAIDAAANVPIAKVLNGFVQRKVIKQSVMTYVYGVTRYGVKNQITKQLKTKDLTSEDISRGSFYLMNKTFKAIQQMFTTTKLIQNWFDNCSRAISGPLNMPVQWMTPLNFPVVQPYFKPLSTRIISPLQNVENESQIQWKPNMIKQKNGFAPNFIHSLDSTHMMLTALHCTKYGMSFAAVHDSFWTHTCSIDLMNKITREQFIKLHSEPLLENLSQFFLETYEPYIKSHRTKDIEKAEKIKYTLSDIPQKGSFELRKVLDSVYFFS